jgi:hypothetical protein
VNKITRLEKCPNFALILGVINPKMGGLVLCTSGNDLTTGAMLMQRGQVITYEYRNLTPIELPHP